MATVTVLPLESNAHLVLISIDGEEFKVLLRGGEGGKFCGAQVYCSLNADELMGPSKYLLLRRLSEASSTEEASDFFIDALMAGMIRRRRLQSHSEGGHHCSNELLRALSHIGWKRVLRVSDDPQRIDVKAMIGGCEAAISIESIARGFHLSSDAFPFVNMTIEGELNWIDALHQMDQVKNGTFRKVIFIEAPYP